MFILNSQSLVIFLTRFLVHADDLSPQDNEIAWWSQISSIYKCTKFIQLVRDIRKYLLLILTMKKCLNIPSKAQF